VEHAYVGLPIDPESICLLPEQIANRETDMLRIRAADESVNAFTIQHQARTLNRHGTPMVNASTPCGWRHFAINSRVFREIQPVDVPGLGGELEKQVNVLKSDPATRARITLAIEEIVKSGQK